MAFTFKPEELFSKGIVYAEFFDPATDDLLGYSRYVSDFGLAGAMNNGEVEGGPGNALIMMIPDTTRLNVTATTADSSLNNMGLPVGGHPERQRYCGDYARHHRHRSHPCAGECRRPSGWRERRCVLHHHLLRHRP